MNFFEKLASLAQQMFLPASIFQQHNHDHLRSDPKIRIQFILKHRETLYTDEVEAEGQYSSGMLHSGLFNSANFMNDMLNEQGFVSEIVHVADNNCIDREVARFKPNVVIIEAFWVVPEKFEVLAKLHPNVKWVIRNHSKTAFLANEGIAYDWAMRYSTMPNVYLSSNSKMANDEMTSLFKVKNGLTQEQAVARCPYLPNYYPMEFDSRLHDQRHKDPTIINISCFGAIRPLKNHMTQAVAAIRFADAIGKTLRFHINGNRVEGNGNNVLKNLRSMFSHLEHELVEHQWMPHDQFIKIVAKMDIAMQASYTETYNIVAADHVSQGVPVVSTTEIEWNDPDFYCDPNSSDDMVRALAKVMHAQIHGISAQLLRNTIHRVDQYNEHSILAWKQMLHRLA